TVVGTMVMVRQTVKPYNNTPKDTYVTSIGVRISNTNFTPRWPQNTICNVYLVDLQIRVAYFFKTSDSFDLRSFFRLHDLNRFDRHLRIPSYSSNSASSDDFW